MEEISFRSCDMHLQLEGNPEVLIANIDRAIEAETNVDIGRDL